MFGNDYNDEFRDDFDELDDDQANYFQVINFSVFINNSILRYFKFDYHLLFN